MEKMIKLIHLHVLLLIFKYAVWFVNGQIWDLPCNTSTKAQSEKERWTYLKDAGFTLSRDSHAAASFLKKIWVVGGVSTSYYTKRLEKTTARSDIVSSEDGIKWVEVLEEAPFRRRFGHTLNTYLDGSDNKERLVLLGGFSPEPSQDVWSSLDGVTWAQSSKLADWSGRGYHCTVSYKNDLWIMGGSPLNNEVWHTTSVVSGTWKQENTAPWSPREAHACATHKVVTNATEGEASIKEFIFLMGGWDGSSLNDVWRMDSQGEWLLLTPAAPWKKRAWFSLVSFESRSQGDLQLGPRLWVIGGGVIGKGVERMFPYSDTWFTRNGTDWVEASSDDSGISTADWSMVKTRDKDVCTGKWGHVVVPFHRKVDRVYYCNETCVNEANNIRLGTQLIPMCDPSTSLPSPPVIKSIIIGNDWSSKSSKTFYPDGCGLCVGQFSERYVNDTEVPALYLIAGNVGSLKVKEIFVSNDAMLCEKNGEICSNQGVCTLGGNCLCNAGKTGQFCEADLDYTIIDSDQCFTSTSLITLSNGATKAIDKVEIGEKLLTIDTMGNEFFSPVYYIPHEHNQKISHFIRIFHEYNMHQDWQAAPLEITPDHLIYVSVTGASTKLASIELSQQMRQIPVKHLRINDMILVINNSNYRQTVLTRVLALQSIVRPGGLTVYTTTGNLIVNHVLCSSFSDLYPVIDERRRDLVAHQLFSGHRLLFAIFPHEFTSLFLRQIMNWSILPWIRWIFL